MLVKLVHFIAPEGKDFFADEKRVADFKSLIGSKFGSAEAAAAGQVYAGIQVSPAKITRIDVFAAGIPVFNESQTAASITCRNTLEAVGFDIITDDAVIDAIEDVQKLGDFTQLVFENGVLVTEIKSAA